MKARTLKAMLGELGFGGFHALDDEQILMWQCERCGFEIARARKDGPPFACLLCHHPAMDGTPAEPAPPSKSKVPNSLEAWCRSDS